MCWHNLIQLNYLYPYLIKTNQNIVKLHESDWNWQATTKTIHPSCWSLNKTPTKTKHDAKKRNPESKIKKAQRARAEDESVYWLALLVVPPPDVIKLRRLRQLPAIPLCTLMGARSACFARRWKSRLRIDLLRCAIIVFESLHVMVHTSIEPLILKRIFWKMPTYNK